MNIELLKQLIPLLIPLLLIQLGMMIYALLDLKRRERTRGPRWLWALVLILTTFGFPSGLIACGLYLAWGRHAEE